MVDELPSALRLLLRDLPRRKVALLMTVALLNVAAVMWSAAVASLESGTPT